MAKSRVGRSSPVRRRAGRLSLERPVVRCLGSTLPRGIRESLSSKSARARLIERRLRPPDCDWCAVDAHLPAGDPAAHVDFVRSCGTYPACSAARDAQAARATSAAAATSRPNRRCGRERREDRFARPSDGTSSLDARVAARGRSCWRGSRGSRVATRCPGIARLASPARDDPRAGVPVRSSHSYAATALRSRDRGRAARRARTRSETAPATSPSAVSSEIAAPRRIPGTV